jgi:F420-non-reducing hydrogenase large subunit
MQDRITIDPITRLEGHGKIEIFLDHSGNVKDAFWQVTELRGFEKFCEGRPAEEMTRIMPNICGVCPSAHHMAATKALDQLYGVEPTPTARLLRQLEYNAFVVEDHFLHFFFLAAPDLILGMDTPPEERNIAGLLKAVGKELGNKVIETRKNARKIIQLLFGKAPHPEGGLPGGIPRGVNESERKWIKEVAESTVEFAQYALKLFKDLVLKKREFNEMLRSDAFNLKTCYMALVDDAKKVSFYEGKVRVIDPTGKEIALFDPSNYLDHIQEHVEPWTYVKFPFLRQRGWKGFEQGEDTSIYSVGPLARLNVADGMATPFAQREYEVFFDNFKERPVHNRLAFHWARLICALQAAEHMKLIASDQFLTSKDIRNMSFRLKREGIGCVEAPRGTLFHHYKTDESGFLTCVNLLVATQHNAASISMSVKEAAKAFIKGGEVRDGLLNRVEMAFRAYDPCLACATHAFPGRIPLRINIRNSKGNLIMSLTPRGAE